jgi:hypothetical protein
MKMTNAMTENIKRNGAGFYSRVFDTFFIILFIAILMIRTMESDIILNPHDGYLLIRQNIFGDTRTVLFDQGAIQKQLASKAPKKPKHSSRIYLFYCLD